ncbi:hypothetical protein BRC94_12335 [Halobacteriales archaeon QS_5_70_17]|nr:MAG: hypothetical protein BRC94_12335 [Halobacteriales archaeon QS_5_70_17]
MSAETRAGAATAVDARHVALIVRTELVRRWRAIAGDRRRLVAAAVGVAFGAVPLAGAVLAAYVAGRALAAGTVAVPLPTARGLAAAVAAVAAGVTCLRAVQTTATPARPDGLLTTVPHREAVAGLLATELTLSVGIAALPAAGVGAAFAVAARSPASAPLVALAVLALVALGVVSSFAAGLAVRVALARSPTLARYRTALAVALFAGYFLALTSRAAMSAVAPVARAAGATPPGWFADLALLPVAPAADPARAGGALAAGGKSATASFPLALPRPVAAVVRTAWLRARRGPIRLLYVTYPLVVLYPSVAEAAASGTVPTTLPPLIALYGAWTTGAAFSLNPIGDEGPVLPATLTAPVGGRGFVGGRCLAGAALGVPATALLAVGAAVASGLDPVGTAAVAAGAVALPAAATGVAAGAGTLFPRMEPTRITRGREAVVPSLFAFALYSLVLAVAGAPATAVGTPAVREVVVAAFGVGPERAVAAGVAATTLLAGTAGAAGFRYAVRSFDRYYL